MLELPHSCPVCEQAWELAPHAACTERSRSVPIQLPVALLHALAVAVIGVRDASRCLQFALRIPSVAVPAVVEQVPCGAVGKTSVWSYFRLWKKFEYTSTPSPSSPSRISCNSNNLTNFQETCSL